MIVKEINKDNNNDKVEDKIKEIASLMYKKAKPLYDKYNIPLDGIFVNYGVLSTVGVTPGDPKRFKAPEILLSLTSSKFDNDQIQIAEINDEFINIGLVVTIGREERSIWYDRNTKIYSHHYIVDSRGARQLFAFHNQRGASSQSLKNDSKGNPTQFIEQNIDKTLQNIEDYIEFMDLEYRKNYIDTILNSRFEYEISTAIINMGKVFQKEGELDSFWLKLFENLIDRINNGDKRKAKKLIRLLINDKNTMNYCMVYKPSSTPLYNATDNECFLSVEARDMFIF